MFSWYVAHVFYEWLWNSPVAPIITDIIFVFTFHMRCISYIKSLYFRIFSASFLITFLSPEIATSINIHVPFSLSRIKISGLLLGIVVLVDPQKGYIASLTCFYWSWHKFIPVFLSNCIPVSLHMLKCSCAHTLSCPFMYCSFAGIGNADIYAFYCLVKLLVKSALAICLCV